MLEMSGKVLEKPESKSESGGTHNLLYPRLAYSDVRAVSKNSKLPTQYVVRCDRCGGLQSPRIPERIMGNPCARMASRASVVSMRGMSFLI